jgi:hypothetical protein
VTRYEETEVMPGFVLLDPAPQDDWAVCCPKCKAARGCPCTYMRTVTRTESKWNGTRRVWQTVVDQQAGSPTKKSHFERLTAYRRQQAKPPVVPTWSSPAVKAVREADLLEYQRMREWLRSYWRIFERGSDG